MNENLPYSFFFFNAVKPYYFILPTISLHMIPPNTANTANRMLVITIIKRKTNQKVVSADPPTSAKACW